MILTTVADFRSACHLHRTILPFRHLPKDFPQHTFNASLIDPSDDYDVLYLYGCLFLSNLPEIMQQKRRGKKIVFSLDDDIWHWPQWRNDKCPEESKTTVEVLIEVADHIIASTPTLAEVMGRPEKTSVSPNLLEVSAYDLPTPPEDDDRIRILWSGAASHRADLDLIDGACLRVAEKYGSKVEFIFVGAGPDRTLTQHWMKGAKLIHWQALEFYWETLRHFKPHICLAPLVDCSFNRSKSAIRVQESWAMNAALVYSEVGEYAAVNEDGVTGLKAESEDEWFESICRLVEDRGLRESLAVSGYQRVKAEWDWLNPQSRLKWSESVKAIEGVVGVSGQ